MDMENLAAADGNPNGTFVVVTQPLPPDLVITTAEIQPLRDQLKQEEESEKENQDSTQAEDMIGTEDSNENKITVTSKDETVAWTFANGAVPEKLVTDVVEKELDLLPIIGVDIVALVVAAVVTFLIIKKRK